MLFVSLILAGIFLLQKTVAQAYHPKTKTNFSKDGVPARWAPGHPKTWGSEAFNHSGARRHPEEPFDAIITEDEKYLVIRNGTHLQFTDLDTNTVAGAVSLGQATLTRLSYQSISLLDLKVLPAAQGGCHVLAGHEDRVSDPGQPDKVLRVRIGPDLQQLGSGMIYNGRISAISAQGRLVLYASQHIYDLAQDTNTPLAALDEPIRGLSFGPDGVILAATSPSGTEVSIWNSTSGTKLHLVAQLQGSSNAPHFSPDGRRIALVRENRALLIYDLTDLEAPPKEVAGDNMNSSPSWSPTGGQIAIADERRLRVLNVPGMEMAQSWELDLPFPRSEFYVITDVGWLDGGRMITWVCHWGRYVYDFEANALRLWTVRATDRSWGRQGIYLLKTRGYVVTVDGDSTVRFWKE